MRRRWGHGWQWERIQSWNSNIRLKAPRRKNSWTASQCGLICGAIEESSRSLKAIDECVFTNFRDKHAVFTNFRDKNAAFTNFQPVLLIVSLFYRQPACPIDSQPVLSIANLFYRQPICSIDSQSVISIANLFYRQQTSCFDSQSVLSIASLFYQQKICSNRSLGAPRAPTSSLRPFGPA